MGEQYCEDEEEYDEEDGHMTSEEMQRFLDWCAMKGLDELTAYQGLMHIIEVEYRKVEPDEQG